ncbi:carboxypeptidase-like regulatory domain-containing protein [Mangrovivirga sp. M17]|uniref:Carboxypeptidase-like regulatory domain-containing protein n=1 Tax=Mangrovivirga halotolerans TaxID=2993936 RepID=A0ABT3RPS7_9BACT|nr:carboxypeptidase-like regulatory domain-containing protein [Mangrovivirga halotolerans]MCX2743610.1 carboxypeptidase-like regulatory domain-containing protein [Mangrovivirga halotolerans]
MRNFLVFVLLLSNFLLFSQTKTIRITVIESETEEPVPYVNVMISDGKEGTNANENGVFELIDKVKYLGQDVILSCVGYESVTISFKEMRSLDFIKMTPNEQVLNEVMVSANEIKPEDFLKKTIEAIISVNKARNIHYYNIDSEITDYLDTLTTSTINQIAYLDEIPTINIVGAREFDKDDYYKLNYYAAYPWTAVVNHNMYAGPFLNPDNLKHFDYQYDFSDATIGYLKIDFNATKLSKRVLTTSGVISYSGSLIIEEESELLKRAEININYADGGMVRTQIHFAEINNEFIPVFAFEKRKIGHVIITNHINWLKYDEYTGQELIMDHDLEKIIPSDEFFENYNNYVKEL